MVRARAVVEDTEKEGIRLNAVNLKMEQWLSESKGRDPFAQAVRLFFQEANLPCMPNLAITVESDIPIASGLGSGAAMAAAVIRALAIHLGFERLASDQSVSKITYQVEKLLHGTPSGIDNTVVSFEKPVYFMRQEPENIIEPVAIGQPMHLLIADSGIASSTKEVVGDVRKQWLADKDRFEELFDSCGRIANDARESIEGGDGVKVGQLMRMNHDLLVRMTVSSTELDSLVAAAVKAGALGAKLSGGGRGGNVIALVEPASKKAVRRALVASGAKTVLASLLT
jgi:mevalonate kinase